MKKIFSQFFYEGVPTQLINGRHIKSYGNNLLQPFFNLRSKLYEIGIELQLDMNGILEGDWVILFDVSSSMLNKLNEKYNYILMTSESPIYCPSSHELNTILNPKIKYILTWSRIFSGNKIIQINHPYPSSFNPSIDFSRIRNKKGVVISSFKDDPRGNTFLRDKFYWDLAEKGFIDLYGRGWPKGKGTKGVVEDKIDIISHYSYSLVVENSYYSGYVTEKLPDTILAETPCIYWGDILTARERFGECFVGLDNITFKDFLNSYSLISRTDLSEKIKIAKSKSTQWDLDMIEKTISLLKTIFKI